MIISEQWLRDWVHVSLDANAIATCLTNAGLEVDSVQPLAGTIDNLVVGKVIEVIEHPDADRLKLTKIDIGNDQLEIVCGASNVEQDMLVAVATVGAKLPNGLKIKKAKVRGIESNGMLCSAAELALEESSAGILELDSDAQIGQRVDEYLQLDDNLIDIDLTPNRGDCLSVQGIARELKVLADGDYHPLDISSVDATISNNIDVVVEDSLACPRYLARVIKGVDADAKTPLWMQERLRRCGVRPISAIVDIGNYVMLELGQPLHAFDLTKLNGGIVVRQSRAGEVIDLLDDSQAVLDDDTLVIADANGVIAVAGVMGGADSAIDTSTVDIVLEAAHFTRKAIAGRSRRYGLHTEASHRFERGVDPQLPLNAIQRASELILAICGGEVGPINEQMNKLGLSAKPDVEIRLQRLRQLLGMPLDPQEVTGILNRIADKVTENKHGWCVTPPDYRFDIVFEADLVEEVARVKGYENIPTAIPRINPRSVVASESRVSVRQLRQTLVARDFNEAITYSFISPDLHRLFSSEEAVELSNPLAENMSVMRSSLIPGLMAAAQFNSNRQRQRVRLFEVGASYHIADENNASSTVTDNRNTGGGSEVVKGIVEVQRLAGIVMGPLYAPQWGVAQSIDVDFFDLKADLEAVLALTGIKEPFIFNEFENISMHPGQVCSIMRRKVTTFSSVAEGSERRKVTTFSSEAEGSERRKVTTFSSVAEGSERRKATTFSSVAEGSERRKVTSFSSETIEQEEVIDIGFIGRLHPGLLKQFDLPSNVFVFELNLDKALEAELPKYRAVSKFPSTKRDLSVVVDQNIAVSSMLAAVKNTLGQNLSKVQVFDVYQGEGVEKGLKSVSLSLVLQHLDKTMTDDEAENLAQRALVALSQEFAAELRS